VTTPYQQSQVKPEDEWTTPKTCKITSCDWPKPTVELDVPYTIKHNADYLTDSMGNKEWIGYLLGKQTTDEKGVVIYEVMGIRVPKQEVSYSSAKVEDDTVDLTDVIGTIHSHHSMGSFLSGTDHDNIVRNHAVTIVISNKDGWKAWLATTTPCGGSRIIDQPIVWLYENSVVDFFESVKANITEYKYKPPAQTYQPTTASGQHLPAVYRAPMHGVGGWQLDAESRKAANRLRDTLYKAHKKNGGALVYVVCESCRTAIPKYLTSEAENLQLCPECFVEFNSDANDKLSLAEQLQMAYGFGYPGLDY
jgi:proteasome lid subunit RPN8/RPN11